MKRFRPRAKGRASPIKKPFSRITIILEEKKKQKESNKMGQKINPIGLRWRSTEDGTQLGLQEKDFGKYLIEDFKIRNYKNMLTQGSLKLL